MTKILCDLHHGDLYYSLQLLFEKRLGFEMYRPIGLEWYHEKFWHVFNHIATANQFLGLTQAHEHPTNCHGELLTERELINWKYRIEDGIYYVEDTTKENVYQRAITLEKFKSMKFDIVISSMPAHIGPFNKLIQQYQPQAKHIFQVGNSWGRQGNVKNILSSTAPFSVPDDVNAVFYHQEFDLGVFEYEHPVVHDKVDSYIHYMKEESLLGQYSAGLPGWGFSTHGAGMGDCFHKTRDIAECMMDSGWTWHVKPGGDGYGHILHNSYACGRPLILRGNYYQNSIASPLLEDQVTCVDVSQRSVHENCKLLRQLSCSDRHYEMCEKTYQRFKSVVDFDNEEQLVRQFVENLR